jgi:hypothetical protein
MGTVLRTSPGVVQPSAALIASAAINKRMYFKFIIPKSMNKEATPIINAQTQPSNSLLVIYQFTKGWQLSASHTNPVNIALFHTDRAGAAISVKCTSVTIRTIYIKWCIDGLVVITIARRYAAFTNTIERARYLGAPTARTAIRIK